MVSLLVCLSTTNHLTPYLRLCYTSLMHIDYFTSDLHLGHLNIRAWRGLDHMSDDEHNQFVIDRYNDVVRPQDVVLLTGDLIMGKMKDNLPLIGKLHGIKKAIAGNHDRFWLGNPKRIVPAHNWPEEYLAAGLDEILLPGRYDIDGIAGMVKVDHFPYYGDDRETDRHFDEDFWRPDDEGHWLIHGHVHGQWKQLDKQINVGIDAWGYPVSPDQITDLINSGEADIRAVGLTADAKV